MINRIFVSVLLVVAAYSAHAQESPAFKYQPYFSAVIANNVDSSTAWYQTVFRLKVKDRINDPERGFKVVIVESSSFLLELIENKPWLVRKKVVEGKPEGTLVQVFFKIGFKVPGWMPVSGTWQV